MPAPLDDRPPSRDREPRVTSAEHVFAWVVAVAFVSMLVLVLAVLVRLMWLH